MKRTLLVFCILVWAVLGHLSVSAGSGHAQSWPTKPIVFVVPAPAGGGMDIFARPLAEQLGTQLGMRVLIDNRSGAAGTVGASYVSRAAPDGYTFLIGAAHHAIAPAIYSKLDYDIEKDFIPIGIIAMVPQVIVVTPNLPVKSLSEFIEYAKTKADSLTFGSAGIGTTHHLAGELFKLSTNTRMLHVPYRGAAPAMQDLIAGHIQVMFDTLGTSTTQITGGAVRALATATQERVKGLPDVPTTAEAGLPGFVMSTWYALWAPKGVPAPIVDRMIAEVKKALQSPLVETALKRNGSETVFMLGPDFGKFVGSEVVRWRKVATQANIKAD